MVGNNPNSPACVTILRRSSPKSLSAVPQILWVIGAMMNEVKIKFHGGSSL